MLVIDPTQATVFGSVLLISAAILVVIVVCFWDVLAKISSRPLLISIVVATLAHILFSCITGAVTLQTTERFDLNRTYRSMSALNFHITYRALIILSLRDLVVNAVSGFVFVGTVIVSSFCKRFRAAFHCFSIAEAVRIALYTWCENFLWNLVYSKTWLAVIAAYVTAIWHTTVLVGFYLISQFAIIRSMTAVYKVHVSFGIILKIGIRSIIYATLSVAYVLIGGGFLPGFTLNISVDLIIMMLLSDALTVRDIVEFFRNGHKDAKRSSNNEIQRGSSGLLQ
ncbi:hypothetical protein DFJ73DRAFT_830770 [Zopfochytrium polystomum]|nr:hypothetical protein DFJ73DRAFT_830770 [Zopfochytrium polystomum]